MDYTLYAKDLLRRRQALCGARRSLTAELKNLEAEERLCAEGAGTRPGWRAETGEAAAERARDCRLRLCIVERELEMIARGMEPLDDYQRALLERFFIDRAPGAAEALMERFYKERSSLYRDRQHALELFTRVVYGVLRL